MAYAGIGRFLLKHADIILGGAYAAYSLTEQHDVATGFQGRRCQVVLSRGTTEDVVVNTFDFVNITSGVPDTTWTSGDFSGVEARLRTFYAALTTYIPSAVSLREFRWSVLPNPAGEENPAVRVAPPATALTFSGSSSVLPPQVACTLTKVTPIRRHWGRVYIGPLNTSLATTGRFGTAFPTALSTAAQALVAGAQADDTPMVVWNRASGVALGVEGTRVDDVPDVVRSRRFRSATARYTTP